MTSTAKRPTVFMMDLLATVPYYTAYLSEALLRDGVNLTVGSISYYLDPACFASRGIKVDPGLLDVVGKFRLPQIPRRALKLVEAFVNLSALTIRFMVSCPDVIHVQYLPMLKWRLPLDFWFLKLCRKRGARIVLTVHDLLPHDSGDVYRQQFSSVYKMVDRIICHSDHIKTRLTAEFSIQEDNVSVIPHGPFFYDLALTDEEHTLRGLGLHSHEMFVLWQGIIFPYKGIDLLLRAWQHVEARGIDVSLMIAGTGAPDLLYQVREQIKSMGLKRVRMHFHFISTKELVALYRAASIVVYPYRAITTSGALATGLALGKAIVASDLPVFRELLTSRENALLIDPQNEDELAAALIELTQSSELRRQLEVKVQEMNFGDQSWIKIAKMTVEAYDRVSSYAAIT